MKLSDFRDIFVRPLKNIPQLDGVRALAVLCIVAVHVNIYYLKFGGVSTFINDLPPFRGGWVGVPLFFL